MVKTFCIFYLLLPIVLCAFEDDPAKHMGYIGIHGYREHPIFRLNVKIGMGYRIAQVPDTLPLELIRYIEGMRLGRSLSADMAFFFTRFFGFGLDLSYFSTSDSARNVVTADLETGEITGMGDIEDNVSILMIGLALCFRKVVGGGNQLLHACISPGKIYYKDESTIKNRAHKIKGSAYGANLKICYDYRINKYLGIGMDVAYLIGSVSNLSLNGKSGKIKGHESMNRLDILLGIKAYL